MGFDNDADVAKRAIALLDLTDLGDTTSADAADDLCARGRAAGVAAVSVWPAYVALCVDALAGSEVRVATVVNFPSGDEPHHAVSAQHVGDTGVSVNTVRVSRR